MTTVGTLQKHGLATWPVEPLQPGDHIISLKTELTISKYLQSIVVGSIDD